MSEFYNDVTSSFDQDFGITKQVAIVDRHEIPVLEFNSFQYYQDIYNFQDPLKHVHKYQFKPLVLDTSNMHFVNPHWVEGYVRQDGTVVSGYYRDGDGDTNVNRTVSQGGGYFRSNP